MTDTSVKVWNLNVPADIEEQSLEDNVAIQEFANTCSDNWKFGDIVYFNTSDNETKWVTYVNSENKLIPFDKVDQGGDETLQIPLSITKHIPFRHFFKMLKNQNHELDVNQIDFVFEAKRFEADFWGEVELSFIMKLPKDSLVMARFSCNDDSTFVLETIYILMNASNLLEISISPYRIGKPTKELLATKLNFRDYPNWFSYNQLLNS